MGYYVYKNGRSVSDFENYEDARIFANMIGGDVLSDIVVSQPNLIEEINDLKWEYWHKCEDDNYPECKDDSTLIAYKDEDEKWHYWTYDNCPYGWNVLCSIKAYWKTIKSPEDEL